MTSKRNDGDVLAAEPVSGVFVVEDDPHTRARLSDAIEQDSRLTLAGSAASLQEARAVGEPLAAAAVALVDLGLPDGDGADLIAELAGLEDGPRVLVISVFGDERRVIRAIEAGADGYLLKDSEDDAIADAVAKVIAGESPISPAIARHLLRRFRPASEAQAPSPITPRETEVLTLIARGYSNAEVAELLSMSANTVTSHTKSIYRKLAVNSRSEAVFEAAQLGLISLASRTKDR